MGIDREKKVIEIKFGVKSFFFSSSRFPEKILRRKIPMLSVYLAKIILGDEHLIYIEHSSEDVENDKHRHN